MIFCIGNSHVNLFSQSHPATQISHNKYFMTFNVGPSVAYNFYKTYYPTIVRQLFNGTCEYFTMHTPISPIPKGSYILYPLGEIDCRFHLPKHIIEDKLTIEQAVQICVDRFMIVIENTIKDGYKPIGWATHPTRSFPHNPTQMPPYYGDPKLRNEIALYYNIYQYECFQKLGLPFYSIYEQLVTQDNVTKEEFFWDELHLDIEKVYPLVMKAFN